MSIDVTSLNTVVVSWTASQSACDSVITNYTVIYQGTSGRITKYTSNTSLVIEGLALNGQYTVSVAAVNSRGDMSTFSNASTLITPAPPTQPSTGGNAHDICRRHSSV